ncbi:MAG: VOC family protein [Candidatus Heimdallarchaeota archaeon]|nr:VOC family protein [Candidatus Heimdallarchaeota archaeon]
MAIVRYLVNDVKESVSFYNKILGFDIIMSGPKEFAMVSKEDLTIWLSGRNSSAAKAMPNGDKPVAGGWNRFVIEVDSINNMVEKLETANVNFRNNVLDGVGGRQVLVEDPSGNPIEIFESK